VNVLIHLDVLCVSCQDSITVHIRSTKGPIDVYLCEVEENHSNGKTSDGVGTSLSKSKHPESPEKGKHTSFVIREI
jgi:transcription factor E2F6